MLSFKEKIEKGISVVTAEIGPPKGIETARILKDAQLIRGRVDAINVTDLQSSVMRLGSLAVCSILRQNGFDPIYQLTCRDRNRLALQSDLLSAAALGIKNVSILTGDHPLLGDHPEAKPVFDLDSVQLLQVVKNLQEGFDMNGHPLEGAAPEFCVGAVVNPGADPLELQIIKMEKKIETGAQFFQTQAVYDIKTFENFLSKTKHLKTAIIAGIVLLKSARMAEYMNEHIPGIFVPGSIINEMAGAKNKQTASVKIAVRLIKELKQMCRGIHIMPIGLNSLIPRVLDEAGL